MKQQQHEVGLAAETESASKQQRPSSIKKTTIVVSSHINKRISADLAHLSEPESPERPNKRTSVNSFRLHNECSLSPRKNNESQLGSQHMMSPWNLKEHDPSSFPQPLTKPSQIKVAPIKTSSFQQKREKANENNTTKNIRTAKASTTIQQLVKVSPNQMTIQIEGMAASTDEQQQQDHGNRVSLMKANRRNANRFRSEIVSKQNRTVKRHSRERSLHSTQVINSSTNHDQFKSLKIDSTQMHDSKKDDGLDNSETISGLPLIKASERNDVVPQESELDSFLNRSSIPFKGSPDQIMPVSFGNTMNANFKVEAHKLAEQPPLKPKSKAKFHREYKPARVDIGLRGRMPFDEKLLLRQPLLDMEEQCSSALGKKRHTIISTVDQQERRGRSELGNYSTLMSATTSSVVRGGGFVTQNRHDSVQDGDYGKMSEVTSHPGALSKVFNPKIGPKNQGSEQARKKVQNLLKDKKSSMMGSQLKAGSPENPQARDDQQIAVMISEDLVSGGVQVTPFARFTKNPADCVQTLQISKIDPKQQPTRNSPMLHSKLQAISRNIGKTAPPPPTMNDGVDISHMVDAPSPRNVVLKKQRSQLNVVKSDDNDQQNGPLQTNKLVQENSEKNKNRILLENENTDTHLILQMSTSRDGNIFRSAGVITERPSDMDVTRDGEFNNNFQTEVESASILVAGTRNTGTGTGQDVTPDQLTEVDNRQQASEIGGKQVPMTGLHASYQHQMIQLLAASSTRQYESQLISTERESGTEQHQPLKKQCTCDDTKEGHDHSHQEEQILSLPLNDVSLSPIKKLIFVRESDQNVLLQKIAINKTSSDAIAYDERIKEAPFRRISLPAIAQNVVSSGQQSPSSLKNPEKLKIKQIVREVMQTQQLQQIKSGRHPMLDTNAKRLGIAQPNKHKTKLTNLLSLQERSSGIQSLLGGGPEVGANKRDIYMQGGFKDPLLNMLTSISSVKSDKNTMYGFRKRKLSCLPTSNAVTETNMTTLQPTINTSNDYNDHELRARSTNYKTSRAPPEQLAKKALAQEHAEKQKQNMRRSRVDGRGDHHNTISTMRRRQTTTYSPRRGSVMQQHNRHQSQLLEQQKHGVVGNHNNNDIRAELLLLLHEESRGTTSSMMESALGNVQKWGQQQSDFQTLRSAVQATENIMIRDGGQKVTTADVYQDSSDLTYVQTRLLDSELGDRKNSKYPLIQGSQSRPSKSGFGSKSPKAGGAIANISQITSPVMSRVQGHSKNSISIGNQSLAAADLGASDDYSISQAQRNAQHKAGRSKSRTQMKDSNVQQSNQNTSMDTKSIVQMIELELPNLHTKQEQLSPQRVKVLSREYTSSPAVDRQKFSQVAQQDVGYEAVLRATGFTGDGQINEDSNENLYGEAQIAQDISSIASYLKPALQSKGKTPAVLKESFSHNTHNSQQQTKEQYSDGVDPEQRLLETQPQPQPQPQPQAHSPGGHSPVTKQVNGDYGGLMNKLKLEQPQFQLHGYQNQRIHPQMITDLRLLAEMAKQKASLDEGFTLVSEAATINNDDPHRFRKAYFDLLKQHDIEMQTQSNQIKVAKKKQVKEELRARKMLRNRPRARTQLDSHAAAINRRSPGKVAGSPHIAVDKKKSEVHIDTNLVQKIQEEIPMPETTYRWGGEASKNISVQDSKELMQMQSSRGDSPNFKATFYSQKKQQYSPGQLKKTVSIEQQLNLRIPLPLAESKEESSEDNITSTTIIADTRKMIQGGVAAVAAETDSPHRAYGSKPRFTLPIVDSSNPLQKLDQMNSLAFLENKSQTQTQTNLLERTISNHMSEMSFVHLKQHQLQNTGLREMASTFLNGNETSRGSRGGFKSSLKKLSMKDTTSNMLLSIVDQHTSTKLLNGTLKASLEEKVDHSQKQLMIDFREHGASYIGAVDSQKGLKVVSKNNSPRLKQPKKGLKHGSPKTIKKSSVVISSEGKHFKKEENFKPWSKGYQTNEFIKSIVSDQSDIDEIMVEPERKDEAVGPDNQKLMNETGSTYERMTASGPLNPVITTSPRKQTSPSGAAWGQQHKKQTSPAVVNLFERLQLTKK